MKRPAARAAAALFVAGVVSACRPAVQSMSSPSASASPRVYVLRADYLERAKAAVRRNDARFRDAYDDLLRDANVAMTAGPFSVTHKKRTPPSGDKHDYMSLAPYWWPDSTKPNGLPFIRRDGNVNPESRIDTDSPRFGKMVDAVETLALAFYFSNDAQFGARAAELVRAWFLAPETRMNPNLRYAQAIPGVTDGRGIGIIDTRNLSTVIDAVALLDGAPGWTPSDAAAFRAWCRDYLVWLQTSVQGKEEAIQRNNHGTWYDAQIVALALFTGDTALARRTIAESATQRFATQVAADGSQPEEIARTRPLHYSLFNLEPFNRIAELGRHVGVDFWHYRAPNGADLRAAMLYVAPYLDPSSIFPKPEVTPAHQEEFLRTVRQTQSVFRDASLDHAVARMHAEVLRTERSRLLYPDVPDVSADAARRSLDSLLDAGVAFAGAQLRKTAETRDPKNGYPRFIKPDGSWEFVGPTQWTSGFFAGSLWQMYWMTRAPEWRTLAERWTVGLEENKSRTTTHDLGFLVFDSFGLGYQLTRTPHYRDVVFDASRSLASRFNDRVGAIKSWDTENVSDRRSAWRYPVIVDNLMNLEMLFWASANGGDPAWRRIAERHALTSARSHVRADGSTNHVALFDPVEGGLTARVTWQGAADTSVWARGQAWAIHGFTRAYVATQNPELLSAARRSADWFVAHISPDGIPAWDFNDPRGLVAERDASAAAVAASGLLMLSKHVDGATVARYTTAARRILRTLTAGYLSRGTPDASILRHSVGQFPQGVEIDVGIVYADYYYLEAIRRYRAFERGERVE
jgi:hypothetical protein